MSLNPKESLAVNTKQQKIDSVNQSRDQWQSQKQYVDFDRRIEAIGDSQDTIDVKAEKL